MSLRRVNYVIRPIGACPVALRDLHGQPKPTCDFDLAAVSLSAMAEILQTAPNGNALFSFLEDLLAAGPNLIWKGGGPGKGTEMRRAFSGLFGRFFARAYLQIYHGYTWFAPINGDNFHLAPNYRIKKKTGGKTEMPDWVCAGPNQVAIAEAKGSYQKGKVPKNPPSPIRTASGQITGVRLQKRVRLKNGKFLWRNKSVKGWAIMSRWGTESPAAIPYLYALDPETIGQALTPTEVTEIIGLTARQHILSILSSFGLEELTFILNSGDTERVIVQDRPTFIVDDDDGREYVGAVFSPMGRLDISLTQARELASIPSVGPHLRFVGLDVEGILDVARGNNDRARPWRKIGEQTFCGPDGTIIAPISAVRPRS